MTRRDMEQYKDKTPIAVFPMSNWGGVEILGIEYDIDDYVVCRYNFGEPEEKLHRLMIRTDNDGQTFFVLDSRTIYLDECMRVS